MLVPYLHWLPVSGSIKSNPLGLAFKSCSNLFLFSLFKLILHTPQQVALPWPCLSTSLHLCPHHALFLEGLPLLPLPV